MCVFGHVESIYGHMLIVLVGHREQLGFGCVMGQKMFFLWLLMYWAYQSLSVWIMCVLEMPRARSKNSLKVCGWFGHSSHWRSIFSHM
jgi:hypothetical protein